MIVGVKEAAALIAQWTGLRDVAPADVRELAERGHLRVVLPGDWPLLELDPWADAPPRADWPGCVRPLVTLDVAARPDLPPGFVEELCRIVAQRQHWWAASLSRSDAAEALGTTPEAFDAVASRHGVEPGRSRRYARSDIERLVRLLFAPAPAVRRELAG